MTKDCAYTENILSFEEATRCIGTPEKSRWSLVKQSAFAGDHQSVELVPGVYRFDVIRAANNKRSGVAVIPDNRTGYLEHTIECDGLLCGWIWTRKPNDPNWYIQQAVRDNAPSVVITTPGITSDDIGSEGKAAIYKLD
ncbi:MAG: hypothetical protein LBL52_01775 [Rickettsiales bacterium]|jgi:hypothetical protein|nr:hypothetical protein [Rickettsiales bacterium]